MISSYDDISQGFKRQIFITTLISLISVILSSSFVILTVWKFAKRLGKVSSAMKNVANGNADLTTKVEVQSNDEIGDVAISFNQMAESLEVQMKKEQNLLWSKSNIAEIATSLSGMRDLDSFGKTLLSKLVPLLGASQAVFYVKNMDEEDHRPCFTFCAAYAAQERKHLSEKFKLGEGLIGQAALEKKPIILTEVPADYPQVNSGLGGAAPGAIYVYPVHFEGEVNAVLELATFKPFSETQQSFLAETINSFGIILEGMLGRIQLAKLLEESQVLNEEIQAQSEELQMQQEELRVTNEELEEQAEALRHSEQMLQIQQEELEQTNLELKEKAESLEVQNKKFEHTNREVEKARAELEEKAKQLALSSKYKSEFLANMSHELRTPLNSLLILSKLLADNQEGNLSEKQVKYSKTLYSSGCDLLTLINDILDLAKIESGKTEVNPSKVVIQDIVEFVENRFRPIANEKNLRFNIVFEKDVPPFIYSDEQRLLQVLKNLLSNAFKFTHEGEVTLEIGRVSKDLSVYSFSILDTGIGIPMDKQELIFEAFQQADGTTSRRYGGTGLGLSICRELSILLKGEIEVQSEEGKGSRFTFYVPDYFEEEIHTELPEYANEVASTAEIKEKTGDITNPSPVQIDSKSDFVSETNGIKRLLIVDDDIRQRNSLMELIGDIDVIIKAVSSGAEALEELKVNKFDCMILDLGLTDTNRFDLLKKIKTNDDNQNIQVFIYTGRDLTAKEEMELNKYAHTIIIKDAHAPQRLKTELELYLQSNGEKQESNESAEPSISHTPTGLEGKRILLVDDDVRNVYAIMSYLERYKMDITFAENGRECLEVLRKRHDFDIVLMDIMMPEMDGYEAIHRIRQNPALTGLPIIALTAKAMKEDRDKCISAGASDYIVKPFDPDQLISLIKVWLYQKK
ncbi:response regulator [Bacillus sp. EB600]|uniref:response regulator n=1 Tax=Bacillus sp. EB600 TaxID=2806345 RepID=UPI002108FE46|nr:response regulator [Bacillus sp. EB600]MCQ6280493.1 response regulator [Bacillus sp. EB600]